jgi:putative tryptophan/tyrosine transport system substrate-binding protein
MKRRSVLACLAAPAFAPVRAREPAVIGVLHGASAPSFAPFMAAFLRGLARGGYAEGRNLTIEYRWAQGEPARLLPLAADLVRRKVRLIVAASGVDSARAAKAATATIPVVFCMGADPVQTGLVQALGRPGGNATGVFLMEAAVQVKRMELLRDVRPSAATVAALVNPRNAQAEAQWDDISTAAGQQGMQARRFNAGSDTDLARASVALAADPPDALTVVADSFFTSRRAEVVAIAARHRLPAVFYLREYVAAGGLMSYGVSLAEQYEETGHYAARILAGASPADLPVAGPTRFNLAINLATASALGMQVPVALLARADELVR